MNPNFIFVFILFATFSIINVVPHQLRKRSTVFNPCPIPDVDRLFVKISPDPPVPNRPETYTVSGKLNSHNITAKKTILGIGYANLARQPIGKPYIQVFTDSYKAGKPFSITAKNVPTPKLPDSYIIGVVVGDPTSNSKKPLDVYGCAYAVNSLRGEAYPIAGYPIEEFSYPIAERSYPIAERS